MSTGKYIIICTLDLRLVLDHYLLETLFTQQPLMAPLLLGERVYHFGMTPVIIVIFFSV